MNNISVFPLLLKHRIDKSGRCAIAIRIIRNRKAIATKPVGYKIEPNYWNDDSRTVKASHPNQVALNALIKKKVSEFEQEFVRNELLGVSVTNERIKQVAQGVNNGKSYIEYCKKVIPVRYPKPDQHETRRQHFGELTKLQQFRYDVSFADIDFRFLNEYKAWMVERGNSDNTIWKTFKAMNTMLNHAIKEGGYLLESPFKNFDRGRFVQTRRTFLELTDLQKIERFATDPETNVKERTVAYYFLFMCYAGFRFADAVKHFDYDKHVVNGERIVIKTNKYKTDVDLFIPDKLIPILDYVRYNKIGVGAYDFNRTLKEVQRKAGVSKNLTAHAGRHTFGAMLAELDVPVEKAQKLLGHRDLDSTKIYYHIKNKSLDKEMMKFNNQK